MTKASWKETIEVQFADEGLGFFWNDPAQLRQSIVFVPTLIRALEQNPDLRVGLREERIIGPDGPVVLQDLTRIDDEQVELIRRRYVQDAVVLLDGRASDYRIRTDGVRHGLLEIDVPEERQQAHLEIIDELITQYATENSVPFRCTWMSGN
jgi:hypothetical protein